MRNVDHLNHTVVQKRLIENVSDLLLKNVGVKEEHSKNFLKPTESTKNHQDGKSNPINSINQTETFTTGFVKSIIPQPLIEDVTNKSEVHERKEQNFTHNSSKVESISNNKEKISEDTVNVHESQQESKFAEVTSKSSTTKTRTVKSLQDTHTCETCGKLFENGPALLIHKVNFHEGTHSCKSCTYSFKNLLLLNVHISKNHNGIPKPVVIEDVTKMSSTNNISTKECKSTKKLSIEIRTLNSEDKEPLSLKPIIKDHIKMDEDDDIQGIQKPDVIEDITKLRNTINTKDSNSTKILSLEIRPLNSDEKEPFSSKPVVEDHTKKDEHDDDIQVIYDNSTKNCASIKKLGILHDINSNSEEEPSPSKKLKTNNINETKNVNNSKHEIEQNLVQVGEKFKCNSCGYYYNQSYDDMTTHMCDDFTKVKKLAIEVITSKDNNDFPKIKNDQTEKMKKNTTGMVKCKICDRRINLQFIKSHSKNMHGKFSVDMYEGEIPKSLTESCINLLANKKQEESPSPSKKSQSDRGSCGCGYTTNNTIDLANHMKTMHNVIYYLNPNRYIRYNCNQCDYWIEGSKNRKLFNAHLDEKHPIICKICNKEFKASKRINYERHLRLVHNTQEDLKKQTSEYVKSSYNSIDNGYNLNTCPYCNTAIENKAAMKEHIEKHFQLQNSDYKCSDCDFKTFNEQTLQKHFQTTHRVTKCDQCDYETPTTAPISGKPLTQFEREKKLKVHKFLEHGKHFSGTDNSCKICQKVIGTKNGLRHHLMRVHSISDSNIAKCHICSKSCKSLYSHLRSAHGMIKNGVLCYKCNIIYQTEEDLKQHNEDKHKEKDYLCQVCNINLDNLNALNDHLKIHNNSKSFKCKMCDTIWHCHVTLHLHYAESHKLHRKVCDDCGHVCYLEQSMLDHKNNKIKQHQCQICGIGKAKLSSLQSHLRFAHGDQTEGHIKCKHCEKTYFKSGDLRRHLEITHLRKIRYHCDQCDFKTHALATYNAHVRVVHKKIKRFGCTLCDHKFVARRDVVKHMRLKHGVITANTK